MAEKLAAIQAKYFNGRIIIDSVLYTETLAKPMKAKRNYI